MQHVKDLVDEERAFALDEIIAGGEGAGRGGGKKSTKKKKKKKKPPSPEETFDRLTHLYIRYHQVLIQLEKCHDGIVQPQKRQDIKVTLELVICHIIDLRRRLVELSSVICAAAVASAGNDTKKKGNNENLPQPFPECLDISSALQSMELSPFDLESMVPRYFREESLLRRRDMMDLQIHEQPPVDVGNACSAHEAEEKSENTPATENAAVEESEAAEDIRVDDGDAESQSDDNSDDADTGTRGALTEQDAAIKVQALIRGVTSRIHTKKHREQEAEYIGMTLSQSDSSNRKTLEEACDYAYTRKKQIQLENAETYEVGLGDLRDTLRDEEGHDMRERLYNERMQWVADQIDATQNIPESLEAFYLKDATNAEEGNKVGPTDAKSSKGKKRTAPSTDGQGKNGDKKAGPSENSSEAANDKIQQLLSRLVESVNVFEARWKGKAASDYANSTQAYDEDLAKDLFIRNEVESAIVQDVDKAVLTYLQRVKGSGSKGGGGGKSKKGKGGAAKKKKGGKSGKKGGKKEKLLPGEKLVGSMTTSDMFRVLASSNMVVHSSSSRVSDFIGSPDAFNPLLQGKAAKISVATKGEGEGQDGASWNRSSPSANQLKSSIVEYCILPNGSPTIKNAIADEDNVRSIMLYGPRGCGKNTMVDAVAHHLGALLIKLSPQLLADVYHDKSEATRLIHMIFAIARDERYGPVVIHIEECDQFLLPASGKNVDKSGVVRFQKDLLTYKNRALKKNDRVIIIGTTSQPELIDKRIVKWKGTSAKPEKQGFFEKFLYFPAPGYVDRLMLWKAFVHEKVNCMGVDTSKEQVTRSILGLDFSLLARSSEGYSTGSIRKTTEQVVTWDRLQCLSADIPKPLEEDLITHLTNSEGAASGEDEMRFIGFARAMDEQKISSGDGAIDSKGKAEKK